MTPERIGELRELARSSRHKFWSNFGTALDEALDALEASRTELAALRSALEKYGQHTHKCQRITRSCCLNHEFPCTCGLDKILGEVALGKAPSADKK